MEISKGKVSSLALCAKACEDESSLFIYGKKGPKSTACEEEGCSCICEVATDSNNECLEEREMDTFNLYRYVKRGLEMSHYEIQRHYQLNLHKKLSKKSL